jgi:hypothetical protein
MYEGKGGHVPPFLLVASHTLGMLAMRFGLEGGTCLLMILQHTQLSRAIAAI